MRPFRSLLIYMVAVFVGGALIAPWLYALAQTTAGRWPRLAAQPFPRFLDRALLGVAVLGLYPLLRACGMLSLGDLGLVAKNGKLSNLGRGFLLGFGSLACVAVLEILKRGRVFIVVISLHELLKQVVSAALTAIIVAVLEEFIFRGTLFGILRKVWTWPKALLLSSAVYALVHFIKKTNFIGPVQAWSGLELLPKMFQFGQSGVPMFLALFLAGSILALAYQRTGTLFFSMGLHAGWIFWLKFYGLVGNGNPLENWWTLSILGAVFLLMWRMKPVEDANVR